MIKDNGEISKIVNNVCKAKLAIPPCSADLRTLVGFPVGYHGCCDVEGVDEVFPYGEIEMEDGLMLFYAGFFNIVPSARV